MKKSDLDKVQDYISDNFELLGVQRQKFFCERELYLLKKMISTDYSKKQNYKRMVDVCNQKLSTNDSCFACLNTIFPLCNDENCYNIDSICHDIVGEYEENIKCLNDKIIGYKLANRGIKYISSLDNKYDFGKYTKDKLENVKKFIK